jgi:hypothetical protein
MSEEEQNIETYEDCFVAFLDILGFREIVGKNSHDELAHIYDHFERSINASVESHKKVIESIKPEFQYIGSTIVSDSIILWTKHANSDCYIKIISVVRSLLISGMMNGIPLRGGIAQGSFSFKKGILGPTYFGKALTEAYSLEVTQKWSGVIIQEGIHEAMISENTMSARALIEFPIMVENYIVPVKNKDLRQLSAINWPTNLNRTSEEIREQFGKHGKEAGSEKVKEIVDNTVLFFETMQAKYRETIDYFVVNGKHRMEGLKAFGDICRELGYLGGTYEEEWPKFEKDKISNQLAELMLEDQERFDQIVQIAKSSNLLETAGAWIVEEIMRIVAR